MIVKHYFDDKNMEDSKFKDNFPREDLVKVLLKDTNLHNNLSIMSR